MIVLARNPNAQPARISPLIHLMRSNEWMDTLRIPQVILATSEATARANYYIENLLFDRIAPPEGLEKLLAACTYSDSNAGITSIHYLIARNDGLLLSLFFQIRSAGAYPSEWTNSITLDVTTGIPISGFDLLSDRGFTRVLERVIAEREKLVDADTTSILKDSVYNESREYLSTIFADLDTCAAASQLDPILITDSALFPSEVRCLPHAAQFFDVDWTISLPISTLAEDFNEYGQSILLLKMPHAFAPSDSDRNSLYHGRIGNLFITMMMSKSNSFKHAHYFYDNQMESMPLSGGLEGDSLTLSSSRDSATCETFLGVRKNGSITGTWRKGRKTMPFELHPY